MPPKDMEQTTDRIFLDGKEITGDFRIESVTLPEPEPGTMQDEDMEALRSMRQLKEITFTAESIHPCRKRAMLIFAIRGNDLYLRHPRKLRRKRRWV